MYADSATLIRISIAYLPVRHKPFWNNSHKLAKDIREICPPLHNPPTNIFIFPYNTVGRQECISEMTEDYRAMPRAFDQYLTTREVADILRLTPKTIRELILSENLPATKFGGSWRIKEQDFLSFIRRCEEETKDILQRCRQEERLLGEPQGIDLETDR